MNKIKSFLLVVFLLTGSAFALYGSYWLVKHGSYYFFYESMVIETIKEHVKDDALNN